MNVRYSRRFIESLQRLSPADMLAVEHTIEWFMENPVAEGLGNHALTRTMSGSRAIAVDGDLRIVFRERRNYADVTLLNVGHHGVVYRS